MMTTTMTKKGQLLVAFKVLMKDMLNNMVVKINDDDRVAINNTANLMVKEVSIRTDLR